MAPLPYIAGVIRADLLWTDADDLDVLTRLHFAYTGGPPSATDCNNLASGILGPLITNLVPQMPADASSRGVDVIDLSGEFAATGTLLETHAGGLSGGALPASCCALVNYAIARRYRGGKPRSYLPFGDASKLANGSEWQTEFQTDVNNAMTAFFAAVNGTDSGSTILGGPVSVSYFSGYGTPRPRSNGHLYYPPGVRDTPHIDPITAWHLNLKPGSQRRRQQHSG